MILDQAAPKGIQLLSYKFIKEANNMSPGQTAPNGLVWSWPILFALNAIYSQLMFGLRCCVIWPTRW